MHQNIMNILFEQSIMGLNLLFVISVNMLCMTILFRVYFSAFLYGDGSIIEKMLESNSNVKSWVLGMIALWYFYPYLYILTIA